MNDKQQLYWLRESNSKMPTLKGRTMDLGLDLPITNQQLLPLLSTVINKVKARLNKLSVSYRRLSDYVNKKENSTMTR